MLNMRKHLGSKQEFTNWLTTMYLFYLINRIVDYESGMKLLPEIHARVGLLSENGGRTSISSDNGGLVDQSSVHESLICL
jgi:hypothetical protein